MTEDFVNSYILIINFIGFIAYGINTLLYRYTRNMQIDSILTLLSLFGGSLGIILSIILFDRKAEKENMMSRVFVGCIFVIQIVMYFMIKNGMLDELNFPFIAFFEQHIILIWYIVLINIVTFIVYAIDKYNAVNRKSRIRIVTLLLLAFFGGTIGGLSSMYLFRHKTLTDYFTVGLPLMMVMQGFLLVYFMNLC